MAVMHLQESLPLVGFLASALLPCAPPYVNATVSGGYGALAKSLRWQAFIASQASDSNACVQF